MYCHCRFECSVANPSRYILDKCLSLSFGRCPSLPDYDCDVEFPEPDGAHPFFKNFLALITLAKVHSQIYVRLYSASAARHSVDDRERAIRELDAELRNWWDEWSQIFSADKREYMDSFEHIELQFSYHSSMTLVHRMVPLPLLDTEPTTNTHPGATGNAILRLERRTMPRKRPLSNPHD